MKNRLSLSIVLCLILSACAHKQTENIHYDEAPFWITGKWPILYFDQYHPNNDLLKPYTAFVKFNKDRTMSYSMGCYEISSVYTLEDGAIVVDNAVTKLPLPLDNCTQDRFTAETLLDGFLKKRPQLKVIPLDGSAHVILRWKKSELKLVPTDQLPRAKTDH